MFHNNLMYLLNIFLKFKFKYVISFICVITFYIFAFEKRYFQINSDWKVLCHENSISLCEFELKLTNINKQRIDNLALYSKYENELQIIDIFNSSMTNDDILSLPKIIVSKQNLENFELFDLKQSLNDRIIFVGIDSIGRFSYFVDWQLIYQKIIRIDSLFGKVKQFLFHSVEYIDKDELIILSGIYLTWSNEDHTPFILSINASDGNVIWHRSLNRNDVFTVKNNNHNANTTGDVNNGVFSHWKLNLMEHHKKKNHLKQKINHINLKNNFPVYFTGVNKVVLSKSQKQLKGFDQKQKAYDKNIGNNNYNSLIIIHKNGLNLLDIHTGVVLGNEAIDFDNHSTYTLWPSSDHQQQDSLFQIKFVSKLDHYSKEHIDINHQQDFSSSKNEVHDHKIHCNLVFHKLNLDSTLSPTTNNWFVGHLCDPVNYMDYPRFSEKTWLEDPDKSVAPLITDNYAIPSGLWGRLYHLIGRKLIDTNSKNAICLSSDGLMTSLSSHGHQNWRTSAQIGWLHISRMVKMTGSSFVDSGTKQVYEKYFQPSITEISLSYLNQTIRAVLSLGFESISLVDLSDGYLLATHSLPCTPVDKPVVISVPYRGILSMAGDQIIVVKCENMVIGFSLTHYIPWIYFLTLCLLMISAILFLMWSLDPRNSYFGELWI